MTLPGLPSATTVYAAIGALVIGMSIGVFIRGNMANATISEMEKSWETERRKATDAALAREQAARQKEIELEKMRSDYAKLADDRRADNDAFAKRLRDERAAYLKRINAAAQTAATAGDGTTAGTTCLAELAFVSERLSLCAAVAKDTNERGLTCQRFYEDIRASYR